MSDDIENNPKDNKDKDIPKNKSAENNKESSNYIIKGKIPPLEQKLEQELEKESEQKQVQTAVRDNKEKAETKDKTAVSSQKSVILKDSLPTDSPEDFFRDPLSTQEFPQDMDPHNKDHGVTHSTNPSKRIRVDTNNTDPISTKSKAVGNTIIKTNKDIFEKKILKEEINTKLTSTKTFSPSTEFNQTQEKTLLTENPVQATDDLRENIAIKNAPLHNKEEHTEMVQPLAKLDLKKMGVNEPDVDPTEVFKQQKQENSIYLKKSFNKILTIFQKKVAKESIYTNIPMEDGIVDTKVIAEAAKRCGLISEVRRINILDVKVGPCILLMPLSASLVFMDEKTIYNPRTDKEEGYNPKEIINDYTGYAIFFYEEDLSVGSFIKRTGFLFKSISKFKHFFLEIVILAFLINIFGIIYPFFSMNVYDRVIPNKAFSTLLVLAFGVFLVYIFDFVFKVIKSYIADYISINIGQEVDNEMLYKLINAKSPGITMSDGAKQSLFKELQMVRDFYFGKFIPALIDMPFLVMFLVVLMFISPWVALIPFVASIIIFVANILFQVPLQNTHMKMMHEEKQRHSLLTEAVSGLETIKTFNACGRKLSLWQRVIDKSYRTSFVYNLWVSIASNFSIFIMNIVYIGVVIVGVLEVIDDVMTSGGLIAASTIASKIMAPVVNFAGLVVRYRSINNTLRSLEKIMSHPVEDVGENNYSQKGPLKGHIKFKEAIFFYPGMKAPILNNCSFEIKAKEKVGIIGRTGAGKSTVTRLLLGLDFINKGQILIDNLDINAIHINELRANVGYLPQKSFFFQGTVKENIMLGGTVSEQQYQQACEIAGVSLVTSLSAKGDDMIIMEQGRNISGGQQQIIGLARAIINNPPIIIMDEPTNGMDTTLEAVFMENTKNYIKDKTFVLITHKASQLSLVDRVIVIEQGRVVIDDSKEKVMEMLLKNQNINKE